MSNNERAYGGIKLPHSGANKMEQETEKKWCPHCNGDCKEGKCAMYVQYPVNDFPHGVRMVGYCGLVAVKAPR